MYSVTRGVMAKRKHFLFEEIEKYLRNKVCPSNIAAKGYSSKSNFRRATRKYSFKDRYLFYKKRIVIKDRNRQMEIISRYCRAIRWISRFIQRGAAEFNIISTRVDKFYIQQEYACYICFITYLLTFFKYVVVQFLQKKLLFWSKFAVFC